MENLAKIAETSEISPKERREANIALAKTLLEIGGYTAFMAFGGWVGHKIGHHLSAEYHTLSTIGGALIAGIIGAVHQDEMHGNGSSSYDGPSM